MDFGQSADQRLEQRVKNLEYEIKILKSQIQRTLLDIQEQVLVHYYPELRSEADGELDEGAAQEFAAVQRQKQKLDPAAAIRSRTPRAIEPVRDGPTLTPAEPEQTDNAEPDNGHSEAAPVAVPESAPQVAPATAAPAMAAPPNGGGAAQVGYAAMKPEAKPAPKVSSVSLEQVRAQGLGAHKQTEAVLESPTDGGSAQEQVVALSGWITRLVLKVGQGRAGDLLEAAVQQGWLTPDVVTVLHRVVAFVNADHVPDTVSKDDMVQSVLELGKLTGRAQSLAEATELVEEADLG